MSERPILFSTPMIQAILAGKKTETRRVVTKHNSFIGEGGDWNKLEFYNKQTWNDETHCMDKPYIAETFVDSGFPDKNGKKNYQYLHVPYDFEEEGVIYRVYPRYSPKDILWVKETWRTGAGLDSFPPHCSGDNSPYQYKADMATVRGKDVTEYSPWGKWRPSIFMPRWASRITLEITDIRVQRLQDISEEDAKAEGMTISAPILQGVMSHKMKFRLIWDKINGKKHTWEENPYIWVITFKKID